GAAGRFGLNRPQHHCMRDGCGFVTLWRLESINVLGGGFNNGLFAAARVSRPTPCALPCAGTTAGDGPCVSTTLLKRRRRGPFARYMPATGGGNTCYTGRRSDRPVPAVIRACLLRGCVPCSAR